MPETTIKTHWNQSALIKWEAAQTPARLLQDQKDLERIFSLAAYSPTLMDAMNWGEAHDLQVIVDRTCEFADGYYIPGTGVLALSSRVLKDDLAAVNALVHEIRHAWQDHHGFIPTIVSGFADYTGKLALIEADARAHGKLAQKEIDEALFQHLGPRPKADGATLWLEFNAWFTSSDLPFYTSGAISDIGSKLKIPGCVEELNDAEFKTKDTPINAGIDIKDQKALTKLGEAFNGKSYFPADAHETLRKLIRPAALTPIFLNALSREQVQHVHNIDHKLKKRKPLLMENA